MEGKITPPDGGVSRAAEATGKATVEEKGAMDERASCHSGLSSVIISFSFAVSIYLISRLSTSGSGQRVAAAAESSGGSYQ